MATVSIMEKVASRTTDPIRQVLSLLLSTSSASGQFVNKRINVNVTNRVLKISPRSLWSAY